MKIEGKIFMYVIITILKMKLNMFIECKLSDYQNISNHQILLSKCNVFIYLRRYDTIALHVVLRTFSQ